MGRLSERIGGGLAATPMVAVSLAIALLAVSLGLGIYNEKAGRLEIVRQARVQAQILAGSVAAPLAFDDRNATAEYVNALRANPSIEAAGAYDSQGQLAAGFKRVGENLPDPIRVAPATFAGSKLAVSAEVAQGTTKLGSVYLRVTTETFVQRAMRYLGIAIVVVMASLLVLVLGSSHASLREAHRKLQQEIKDREKAEEALRQSQKMEAMGQLTGGVAHDFNNLLMVASSGLDLMDRTSDPVRRERLKQGIRQAIDRGASLTQQLLAFARKTPLKVEVVDLGDRLTAMRDVLERSLREDISVRIAAAPGLWHAEVDPSQFELAVLNIAINARDAMPNSGEIAIVLENIPAETAESEDRIGVAISDAGIGMSPDMVARAFEPFFTTKGVGSGTGLGLSQVYGFARASGGDVHIQSELGQGTTVSILLPRTLKAMETETPMRLVDTEVDGRTCCVLLVEDDEKVAELVTEMLRELGYNVSHAPTAVTALETLRLEHSFDLVFSDMVMPGEMSGLDLAHAIAREQPELPIVLTTGYSGSAAAAAAEGLRLLVKPYRIESLATELQAALACAPAAGRLH
jgi:signal transduction histidine kinase/CheY-like chemotaxis protein